MTRQDSFEKTYPTNKPKQTCLNKSIGKFKPPFESVKNDIVST